MRSPGSALPLAWLLLLLLGCGSEARRHEARGVVYEVNREFQQILIEHEDIPGLMPAMTMNFDVADPALLDTLATGDRIVFELEFTGEGYRVLSAEKLGQGEAGDLRLEGLARVRMPAPDFDLTDQSGARISLEALRGRTLLDSDRPAAAAASLDKYLELLPEQPETRERRASALLRRGEAYQLRAA